MNEKINRISSWAKGKTDNPITVELNPTNRCNLLCRSCWQREFPVNYDNELSSDRIISLIQEAAELGVKEIRIPGSGEPLVKEGIADILSEIKKQGMYGLLITNGTLLNENIAETLIKLKWDCITISIDGADEETQDFHRGKKGAFSIIKKNLENLKRLNLGGTYLRFNTVITNRNFDRLDRIMVFARSVGCQNCQFQPMTVWGSAGKELELSPEQKKIFVRSIPRLKGLADSLKLETNIACYDEEIVENASGTMDKVFGEDRQDAKDDNPFLSLPCFEPWYNMIILPNGKVSPCSIAGEAGSDDITEKTLKEVWLGEKFSGIRKQLLANNLPDYCRRCCAVVHVENIRIKEELSSIL